MATFPFPITTTCSQSRVKSLIAEIGVGVVPGDEIEGGVAPAQVLAGNVQAAVALRPHRVDDLVVAGAEIVDGDVPAERDVAEVADLVPGEDLRVHPRHRLDGLVVGRHAVAHQPVRRGQPVDEVDRDRIAALEQGFGREEPRRAGTDDRKPGWPFRLSRASFRARE